MHLTSGSMRMNDFYKFDQNYTEKSVITGACALARAGLTTTSTNHLDLQTSIKSLDGLRTLPCNFYYNGNIDYVYELSPGQVNPLLLQPSKERAIVENIAHLDWIDEGILIEALQNYLLWFRNDEKLYKCADHFNVPRETIDYWIREAEEDEEV